jgi:hypothetical protein
MISKILLTLINLSWLKSVGHAKTNENIAEMLKENGIRTRRDLFWAICLHGQKFLTRFALGLFSGSLCLYLDLSGAAKI